MVFCRALGFCAVKIIVLQENSVTILSCVPVTIDGVWIGNWIYWTLTERNYNYSTVVNSLQHALSLFSLLYFHRLLPGNGFQHHSFLTFHVHFLTCLLSHNLLNSRHVLLITPQRGLQRKLLSQQFLCCCVTQLSHGPHGEHNFPVSPLVCGINLLPSNGHCLHSYFLSMDVYATLPPP
jgi:hypothetical protein